MFEALTKKMEQSKTLAKAWANLRTKCDKDCLLKAMEIGMQISRDKNFTSFGKKKTLKQLQKIAKKNKISIYKRKKKGKGYTKTLLNIKQIKRRLTYNSIKY